MAKVTISGIVKTSIVTAFTIAAALIWKDVITGFIENIVPAGEALVYKFIAAVFATIIIVIAIFIILKTEAEARETIKRLKRK